MELAISALTGELVSRFVSFLTNKYHSSRAYSKENQLERLQQLLLRVGMVIEEADSRYIVNSCMLIQLKMLAAAMYRGHHVLDTIRSMKHREFLEKQSALQNLEAGVANMVEFVVLLSGYERISRRPYDAYLYIDNFMFGRHVEKQKILMFLLEYDSPGRPVVLPVIGGNGVGKKTLIAHVCDNERVRSHFSMVLHLNGDDLFRITDHEWMSGKTLVVIEFVSDVDEDDWATFHRSITNMDRGSKVIILGRNAGLEKFGTVKPISLSCLSLEEYSYLFKTLAFGSADQTDHPRLAAMVEKFATVLGGSLISANVLADALRKNLSAHFWLSLLNGARDSVKKNNTRFGAHPQELFSRGHPVHLIGGYILSPATPSRIVKSANSMTSIPEEGLPRIMFGDLIAREGHVVLPRGDFRLISWESRLPPYTSFVHLVRSASSCVNDKPKTPLSGKKRPSLFG
nr:disease resistance protein RGA2-like isoform X3 [Lolium perenne]